MRKLVICHSIACMQNAKQEMLNQHAGAVVSRVHNTITANGITTKFVVIAIDMCAKLSGVMFQEWATCGHVVLLAGERAWLNSHCRAPIKSQLLLYQCHKKVRASKIFSTGSDGTGGLILRLVDGDNVTVSGEWVIRNPMVESGGYFVEYQEGDKYTAYSPAAPFEGGYTLVKDDYEPDF